ncbi:MAG: chromosomal replication initiator protein DnaA [Candidatus Kapabacteria bacterium]|nr:chromosomal replication initiator protein DnaA [Candidatus Kapabacteria bacterium]MBX7153376.1 chromosomal replication initiator protein DnaA [Bacteroidota bacterium]
MVAGKDPSTDQSETGKLWKQCLDIIRDNVSQQVFKTWFEPIRSISWENREMTVQVPSQFFYEWLEEHYYGLLQKTIYQVLGAHARLKYEVVVENTTETLEQRTIKLPAFRQSPASSVQTQLPFTPTAPVQANFPAYLNPRYTFDNFINGESNQLAFSAAQAVSENPGRTRFNPLVLYGNTGLGKTHLVQAIGNRIIEKNRMARVLYTTSERFTMEYVNAIQSNKVNEFTAFYRSVDVLIVDDIQFFAGKEKTQDNFFHTFNSLHQQGKQLILTSDRPPKELQDVDDRLISRFQWGLTADVQLPDYEMRMAILQRKSLDEGMEMPLAIVEYIARHVTSSVRELEGCLISLIAKVSLDGREATLDLAKEVVRGVTGGSGMLRPLNMDDIKEEVSTYYGLPIDLLAGKTRKHEVVLARQVCMYLAKQLTNMSLKSIGSHFGGRDHTTVLHSIQMIENYLDTDRTVAQSVELLRKKVSHD